MVQITKWTDLDLELLKRYYPTMGKHWCCQALNRTEASVRYKASELKLKQDRESDFFKDWQNRAKESKIGKKRPDQALVIKRLHELGKLKKTDEQKRKFGELSRKRILEKGHPKGMLGKKHSPEALQKMAVASKNNYANMSEDKKAERVLKIQKTRVANGTNVFERKNVTWKGGWREINGFKKYYRSRWEANYARFLTWLQQQGKIKSWRHEPETFWFEGIKRGSVSYLPDFWVQEMDGTDAFHEVKGWMDDRSKTKIKRMAKYYPHVKLLIVGAKEYKALEKEFSALIPDWER